MRRRRRGAALRLGRGRAAADRAAVSARPRPVDDLAALERGGVERRAAVRPAQRRRGGRARGRGDRTDHRRALALVAQRHRGAVALRRRGVAAKLRRPWGGAGQRLDAHRRPHDRAVLPPSWQRRSAVVSARRARRRRARQHAPDRGDSPGHRGAPRRCARAGGAQARRDRPALWPVAAPHPAGARDRRAHRGRHAASRRHDATRRGRRARAALGRARARGRAGRRRARRPRRARRRDRGRRARRRAAAARAHRAAAAAAPARRSAGGLLRR